MKSMCQGLSLMCVTAMSVYYFICTLLNLVVLFVELFRSNIYRVCGREL